MPITVVVTSDFLCPWCYLGEARLHGAVRALAPEQQVDLVWNPYELNPDMPEQGMNRRAYRTRKFGWERSLQMDEQLAELGRKEGLAFNFPAITVAPNTRLAHRMTIFAEASGLASAYAHAVFQAYFEQGRDIGDRDTLLDIIDNLGLDPAEAGALIDQGGGLTEVTAAEASAIRQGIRGVPHFGIGNRSISGAQDSAVFRAALQAAGASGTVEHV